MASGNDTKPAATPTATIVASPRYKRVRRSSFSPTVWNMLQTPW